MTVCKHLPATATRDDLLRAHHAKMARKATQRAKCQGMFPGVAANLSVRHPDHGCTPAKHAQHKAARG